MDFIPGVSQLKSAVQVASGDYEGGKKTQENFLVGCPVVSQLVSAAEAVVLQDRESALKRQAWFLLPFFHFPIPFYIFFFSPLQVKFLKVVESALDSVPVVGHIKGGIHHSMGDAEKAQTAMASANRSTGVIVGGVIGGLPFISY